MSPPGDGSVRPGGSGHDAGPGGPSTGTSVPRFTPVTAAARDRAAWLPWAAALIEAGEKLGPIPAYGGPIWHRLDARDPRRVAACVRAAECWRLDGERLPERLREEVAQLRAAREAEEAAAFTDMAAGVRRHAKQPTYQEMEERRYGPCRRKAALRRWQVLDGGDAA